MLCISMTSNCVSDAGVTMKLMDEVAGIVAARHCATNVVTASVDAINFHRKIKKGEDDAGRLKGLINKNNHRFKCVLLLHATLWYGSPKRLYIHTYIHPFSQDNEIISLRFLVISTCFCFLEISN